MNKLPYILGIYKDYWTIYHVLKWINDDTTLMKIVIRSNPINGIAFVSNYESFTWYRMWMDNNGKFKCYSTLEECFNDNFDLFLSTTVVYRNE
mgnify:FL=1